MRPRNRFHFLKPAVIAFPSLLLLAPLAQGQAIHHWRTAVNGAGKRDGIWSTTVTAWSFSPGGPPVTPWTFSTFVAGFLAPEGGTVTVDSPISFGGITAAGNYILLGGSLTFGGGTAIQVSLGSTLSIQNDLLAPGSTVIQSGGGSLFLGGKLDSTALKVNGGSLRLSGNNFSDSFKTLESNGRVTLDGDNTVFAYRPTKSELAGAGTLTVTGETRLDNTTISGHLISNTISAYGSNTVSGTIGGESLVVHGGTFKLTGTSNVGSITLENGHFNSNGGLGSATRFTNNGTVFLAANETISSYSQGPEANLNGTGNTLTVTGEARLHGGTIYSSLVADTMISDGRLFVMGNIGGDQLSVTAGEMVLSGTSSSHAKIDISAGAYLASYGGNLNSAAEVTNAGAFETNGIPHVVRSLTNNGGFVSGGITVTGPTVFHGGRLIYRLIASGGATLHDGTTIGDLRGNTRTHGQVTIFDHIGDGTLDVLDGKLRLEGTSTNHRITISEGATLDVVEGDPTAHFDDNATLINAGTFAANNDDTIGNLFNRGGTVNGSGSLAVSGAVTFHGGVLAGEVIAGSGALLTDGTSVTGTLHGNTTTRGQVRISGHLRGGNLSVETGRVELTGSVRGFTQVFSGAKLAGSGRIQGDLSNAGTLSANGSLTITGNLATDGLVSLALSDAGGFDRIKVGGTASLDGELSITNVGEGLAAGEIATLIAADSYLGEFETLNSIGFTNGVLFDDTTGRLIGLAGGSAGSARNYLNLNARQTPIYLALYEDSVEIGSQNVTRAGDGSIQLRSGLSNGDAQLVAALNAATFATPGTISQAVINRLSPEPHRGMADYAEQAQRAHVREAAQAAPVSQSGRTQVFASAHSSQAGVDSWSGAGYDLQVSGVTSGVRYDVDKRLRIGGLLGADDGSIEGALIDTDARGLVVGAFGHYLVDEKTKTHLSASLSYGAYEFDAERQSLPAEVEAKNIDSDVVELSLGVNTLAYEKSGFRVIPHAALRYLDGNVDGFTEEGAGIPLKVASQDIESLLLDLGVDVEYRVVDRLTLAGNLGYVTDFCDSAENVTGAFAASGALGQPFAVSSPGIDDEAVVLGLGVIYDFSDTIRASLTYRSDFRLDSQDAHSFGLSASFGF